MPVTLEQFGLDGLATDDRLELLELLWDSLDRGEFTPPAWHAHELDRRIAAADADPAAVIPWEQFKVRWLGGT